jgi:hypothetical protein
MSLYCFGLMILVPCAIAWRRIRQGKIQEHKEWVIRGMMVMGGALTMRIFFVIISRLLVKLGRWDGVSFTFQFKLLLSFLLLTDRCRFGHVSSS